MGIPISRGLWELGIQKMKIPYPAAAGEQLLVGNGISEMGNGNMEMGFEKSHFPREMGNGSGIIF